MIVGCMRTAHFLFLREKRGKGVHPSLLLADREGCAEVGSNADAERIRLHINYYNL